MTEATQVHRKADTSVYENFNIQEQSITSLLENETYTKHIKKHGNRDVRADGEQIYTISKGARERNRVFDRTHQYRHADRKLSDRKAGVEAAKELIRHDSLSRQYFEYTGENLADKVMANLHDRHVHKGFFARLIDKFYRRGDYEKSLQQKQLYAIQGEMQRLVTKARGKYEQQIKAYELQHDRYENPVDNVNRHLHQHPMQHGAEPVGRDVRSETLADDTRASSDSMRTVWGAADEQTSNTAPAPKDHQATLIYSNSSAPGQSAEPTSGFETQQENHEAQQMNSRGLPRPKRSSLDSSSAATSDTEELASPTAPFAPQTGAASFASPATPIAQHALGDVQTAAIQGKTQTNENQSTSDAKETSAIEEKTQQVEEALSRTVVLRKQADDVRRQLQKWSGKNENVVEDLDEDETNLKNFQSLKKRLNNLISLITSPENLKAKLATNQLAPSELNRIDQHLTDLRNQSQAAKQAFDNFARQVRTQGDLNVYDAFAAAGGAPHGGSENQTGKTTLDNLFVQIDEICDTYGTLLPGQEVRNAVLQQQQQKAKRYQGRAIHSTGSSAPSDDAAPANAAAASKDEAPARKTEASPANEPTNTQATSASPQPAPIPVEPPAVTQKKAEINRDLEDAKKVRSLVFKATPALEKWLELNLDREGDRTHREKLSGPQIEKFEKLNQSIIEAEQEIQDKIDKLASDDIQDYEIKRILNQLHAVEIYSAACKWSFQQLADEIRKDTGKDIYAAFAAQADDDTVNPNAKESDEEKGKRAFDTMFNRVDELQSSVKAHLPRKVELEFARDEATKEALKDHRASVANDPRLQQHQGNIENFSAALAPIAENWRRDKIQSADGLQAGLSAVKENLNNLQTAFQGLPQTIKDAQQSLLKNEWDTKSHAQLQQNVRNSMKIFDKAANSINDLANNMKSKGVDIYAAPEQTSDEMKGNDTGQIDKERFDALVKGINDAKVYFENTLASLPCDDLVAGIAQPNIATAQPIKQDEVLHSSKKEQSLHEKAELCSKEYDKWTVNTFDKTLNDEMMNPALRHMHREYPLRFFDDLCTSIDEIQEEIEDYESSGKPPSPEVAWNNQTNMVLAARLRRRFADMFEQNKEIDPTVYRSFALMKPGLSLNDDPLKAGKAGFDALLTQYDALIDKLLSIQAEAIVAAHKAKTESKDKKSEPEKSAVKEPESAITQSAKEVETKRKSINQILGHQTKFNAFLDEWKELNENKSPAEQDIKGASGACSSIVENLTRAEVRIRAVMMAHKTEQSIDPKDVLREDKDIPVYIAGLKEQRKRLSRHMKQAQAKDAAIITGLSRKTGLAKRAAVNVQDQQASTKLLAEIDSAITVLEGFVSA